ncbi:hypothetical protein VTO73DRAFT_6685 [Trametes versicolor]
MPRLPPGVERTRQARIRDVELSVQRSGPASRVPSTAAASKLQHTNAADDVGFEVYELRIIT